MWASSDRWAASASAGSVAVARERRDGRGLDDRPGVVEVDDVVAGELGNARGLVCLAAQQPVGDEPFEGDLRRWVG